MKRPAETAGVTGAIALLIGRIAGVDDPDTLVAIGAVVGILPAAVTLLVVSGGVRGVGRKLWRGRGEAGYTLVEVGLFLLLVAIAAAVVVAFVA